MSGCLSDGRFLLKQVILVLLVLICPYGIEARELIEKGEKLSLEKCIQIALKKHPQVMASQNNLDVIGNRIGQAKAGYFPQIDWSTGFSRNASPLNPDQFNQYANSLSVNQNIYDFNRVGTRVNIQNLDLNAARYDLKNVMINITFGVKQAYYEVLRAKHARDIGADTIKQFEQQLETAKGFYEVGIKPIFDVTSAEVNLSNARVNLVRAENAVAVSIVSLNNAMGMPNAPPYDLEDPVLYKKSPVNLDESLHKAFLTRPDLQSLLMQEKAIQASKDLAQKDYFPLVTGNASYGWSGQELPLERGWSVGVALNFNVFSGFLTKHRIGEAEASLEVLKSNEETLRQIILLDVEQAYANITAADKSISAAEITVRQAEENLRLARGRYDAGVGTQLEVTDALVSYDNARLTLSGAIYDYMEAEASLQKARGEE